MSSAAVNLAGAPVLVVGAGIMGAGIAQVAAQAGHAVWLHDTRAGAADAAKAQLGKTLDGLVAKGKLGADAAAATLARITPTATLADAAGAGLVIEAIVEDLAVKQRLLADLEALLAPTAVLATNTSSISVTALARTMAHPGRLVGMHFFNPAALMKLVEVVSGLHTQRAVADAVAALASSWGKTPVHCTSTPGFIVNRIARPYYAETLALLHERAAAPEVLDACLRGAGFRMGPCELMDLIGHDTNFAVTQSVYGANFFDKRYVPSLVQRELVDGGLLGRKSGRGFYRYPEGAPAMAPPLQARAPEAREVVVHGRGALADRLAAAATQALHAQGWGPAREQASDWTGMVIDGARLAYTDGRTAAELARTWGTPDVAVVDRAFSATDHATIAYAVCAKARPAWHAQVPVWLAALGHQPLEVADTPGLVAARTVAMLINEAADAVQQGVCDEAGADAAMKLGVNYPAGPFEWLAGWSVAGVARVVQALDARYAGERYRLSPWLAQRLVLAQVGT